jgi:hypothetical protein
VWVDGVWRHGTGGKLTYQTKENQCAVGLPGLRVDVVAGLVLHWKTNRKDIAITVPCMGGKGCTFNSMHERRHRRRGSKLRVKRH